MPETHDDVERTASAVRVGGRPIEDVFRDTAPRLWHTILAFSGGRRDLADDAVAEAFARAIEHAPMIRNPEPWLYRVALNVVARELKRTSRLTSLDGAEDVSAPISGGASLRDVLGALSPGQRAAVYLHYEEDLPIREIARLMGTSVAVVKVHLYRGRTRLRGVLGDDDDA
jgi:RNA polymerase sigma-70 factor (ECF subfamily)